MYYIHLEKITLDYLLSHDSYHPIGLPDFLVGDTKSWPVRPDVFFLPSLPLNFYAHAHTQKSTAGSRDWNVVARQQTSKGGMWQNMIREEILGS